MQEQEQGQLADVAASPEPTTLSSGSGRVKANVRTIGPHVVIDFNGANISWLALTGDQARALGRLLLKQGKRT